MFTVFQYNMFLNDRFIGTVENLDTCDQAVARDKGRTSGEPVLWFAGL